MAFEEFELYPGKKMSDLVMDIVKNSENTKTQIDILVSDLRPLVKSPADALSIVPLIRDYIDSGIKNDDSLVKLAAIAQRTMNVKQESGENDLMITDEERAALMKDLETVQESITSVKKPVIKNKIEFDILPEGK
jgi:hypothetical protein